MTSIFSSSDTAPLNSVMICCTTVTTMNMLSRDTESRYWQTCLFLLWRGRSLPLYPCAFSCHCNLACVGLLRFLRVYSWCCSKGQTWDGVSGQGTFSSCGLRFSLGSPSSDLFLCVVAAPIVWRMLFFTFRHLTVAICQNRSGVAFYGNYLSRWQPPHHMQRGGWLHLAQTWLNCWQLWRWIRSFWFL
jgi:hypothetical protein